MDFMMNILYAIAKIRCPFLDFFFGLVTKLGEETFFLVFAILFFWCINKRTGIYVLISGLSTTVASQWLKIGCKLPRPFAYDTSFTPVEGSIENAGGYSFPSGHTQTVTGTLVPFALKKRRRSVSIVVAVLILLVGFSRLYLGVHTLCDVLVSLVLTTVIAILLYPVFVSEESYNKWMPYVIAVSMLASLGFLLYSFLINPDGVDGENLQNAQNNAAKLLGCTVAMLPVYLIDKYVSRFETKASWYVQIIKLAVGLGLVLLIKSGLSSPLKALFGNESVARGVRYFLLVLVAGGLYPISFKYLVKIKIPFLDRLPEKLKAVFKKHP